MTVDISKMKPTYGYDERGNRQDLFLQDGKAYTPDGQRVGSGWSVQTGGGVFQQNQSGTGGYKVGSHNRPSYDSYLDSFKQQVGGIADKQKFNSGKDYGQLGQDRYKPIYDAQRQALESQLSSGVRDLENQIAGVDTQYDRNVERQNELSAMAKSDYNAQTLGRGLGRSTIASTGLASMDMANQKAVGHINTDRANTINSIQGKIQSLQEGIGGQLANLDGNRALMEQQFGDDLEDRDFNMWLQQAKLNQGTDNMLLQAQLGALDKQFGMDYDQWAYDRDINREMGSYGWGGGGQEGKLSALRRAYEQRIKEEDREDEHNWSQETLNRRFRDGTIDKQNYDKLFSEDLRKQEEMLKLQKKYTPSYGGGGGGGFTPYSRGGGSYGGSSSKSNASAMYDVANQMVNSVPQNYKGVEELEKFRKFIKDDKTIPAKDKSQATTIIDRKVFDLKGGNKYFPDNKKTIKNTSLKDILGNNRFGIDILGAR